MALQDAARPQGHADNVTGIVAMLASMVAFTLNDSIVKYAGERLPLGEVIVMRNGTATLVVLLYAAFVGGLSRPRWDDARHLVRQCTARDRNPVESRQTALYPLLAAVLWCLRVQWKQGLGTVAIGCTFGSRWPPRRGVCRLLWPR